jgi:hypothetical protein
MVIRIQITKVSNFNVKVIFILLKFNESLLRFIINLKEALIIIV